MYMTVNKSKVRGSDMKNSSRPAIQAPPSQTSRYMPAQLHSNPYDDIVVLDSARA